MVEIDVDFHQIVRYMVLDEKQKEFATNKRSMVTKSRGIG